MIKRFRAIPFTVLFAIIFFLSMGTATTAEATISSVTVNSVGEAATGPYSWDCSNFNAFYYEPVSGTRKESLVVLAVENRTIDKSKLVYRTEIKSETYSYQGENWKGVTYPVICFFGDLYVPLSTKGEEGEEIHPDKLSRLVLDCSDICLLEAYGIIDLGEGYTLEVKDVDGKNNRVWIEFKLDDEYIDDEIIDVSGGGDWEVRLDNIENLDDVVVMKLHVSEVFQEDDKAKPFVAQLEGLWLIDYKNAFTVKPNAIYGEFKVGSLGENFLELENYEPLILERNSVKSVGNGLKFKVVDGAALIYYPFMETKIGLGENFLIKDFYPRVPEISTSEGELQEFFLRSSRNSIITLSVNGKEVKSEKSTTFLSYQNSTAPEGIYYVQATTEAGDDRYRHSWVWIVGEPEKGNSEENRDIKTYPVESQEAEIISKDFEEESKVTAPAEQEEKQSPGFGITFATVGLLSALYFLKRK